MTQEEQKAVEEFTEMNLTKKGLYHYNDMQDAFLIGLFKGEKMQSSLPSNLDEAAKEYNRNYTPFDQCDSRDIIRAFKDGVKWRDANIPKLPDNLDEAANDYSLNVRLGYPRVMDETDKFIYNAFKAGATWRDSQIPKLPSNLDEAAEDGWAVYEYRESPKGLYSTCYIDGFKDGAEWVSGQGENIEGEVVKDINNNLVVKAKGLSMKEVKFGDKVIVQIRKK